MLKVIDAITRKMAPQFPGVPIYTQNTDTFERPSFYVYSLANKIDQHGYYTYQDVEIINVVYFAPKVDTEIDVENQSEVYDKLVDLFMSSPIQIYASDIFISIDNISGGPRDGEIYLSLQYTCITNKTIKPDDSPLMEDLRLNNKKQGGN